MTQEFSWLRLIQGWYLALKPDYLARNFSNIPFVSNADLPGPVSRFSTPFQRNLSYCGVVSSLLASPGNTVMTYCSTYIGDLAAPSFKWNGGDWNGNIPRGFNLN